MIVERPSASALGRAFANPAICWLPQRAQVDTAAADRGTRQHSGLERAQLGATGGDVYGQVWPEEEAALRIAIAGLPALGPPVVPHWPTIEVECWGHPGSLTMHRGMKAACHHTPGLQPPGFYRGTADRIDRNPETGRLRVCDWKSGDPRKQTAPAISAQCYFFAWWLSNHPVTAAEVQRDGVELLVYLTQRGAEPDPAKRHLTFIANTNTIERFGEQLQDLAILLDDVEADRVPPPPHQTPCDYCRCILEKP